jgi:purine catabolism regulator
VQEARCVTLLGDLVDGTALGRSEVVARAKAVGFRPERAHHLVGVAAQAADPRVALAALDRMARRSGAPVLRAPSSGVVLGLISVSASGGDPVRWAQREVSAGLHATGASDAPAVTVALGHAVPAQAAWTRWGDSLRDARATLRLALVVPLPGPQILPLVTSSRALALERELVGDGLTPESHDRLARLVTCTLGPLLEWEANHPSDLVRTLEIHLRSGCSPTRTAALLHIGRQSLYQRLERIESLLGGPVSDPESHAGLLLATCARRVLRAIG